jgi:hypothetical protein
MRRFIVAAVIASSAIAAGAQSGWQAVRDGNGQIKATIEMNTIIHDQDGNAHGRVCVFQDGQCKSPLPWFFKCSDHSYSPMAVLPFVPHEMITAEPGSVADQLIAIACR